MLPTTLFQILSIVADLIIFAFVWYYLWQLRAKEQEIDKERNETHSQYHHVVDEALARERKILEDATFESSQIIAGTKYVTSNSKETLGQALQRMEGGLERDVGVTAQELEKLYTTSLQQVSTQSLAEFQTVIRTMEAELQQQTATFRDSLLPKMEQELDEYKKIRLQQADRTITQVIQQVSQEILNKSLSLDDHQHLLVEALEKARKEGVFG